MFPLEMRERADFPLKLLILFSGGIMICLIIMIIGKSFKIISFREDHYSIYLKNIKQKFYEGKRKLVNVGDILDIKYTFYHKSRIELSRICLHFKTKKYIPIKKVEVIVQDIEGKEFTVSTNKYFEPYFYVEEATNKKWGLPFFDPFIELTLNNFIKDNLEKYKKYQYAKGYTYDFTVQQIKLVFTFIKGKVEEFTLYADDSSIREEFTPSFKLERISIDNEGNIIYPYYNDFINDCTYMYLYDRDFWKEKVRCFYELLSKEENFKVLINKNTDKSELGCLLEFLYDNKIDKETNEFVKEILTKYYYDQSEMDYEKMKIITEMEEKTKR